jgi:MFS transporter, DHA1 family, inner membrane transport protein
MKPVATLTRQPIDSGKLAEGAVSRDTESGRRRERLILLILSAVQFITIVDFIIVMPLGPQLMRSLQIDPAQFGLIVSSYTFASGAAGLVASSIVDRFARRTTFLVLYAGFLLGTFLCAVAPNYLALVAARVATGAFGGILGGLSMTIVGDVFPEERRGRATGMLMSGFALASVAGVPFGLFLGTEYGWHMPFIVLAAGGLPFLFLAPLALPRLDAHLQHAHPHPLRSLVDMFADAANLKAFTLTMALTLGGFAVFPYISAYLVANVGMTEQELPLIYIVGGALTLVAAPIIGKLADRFGKLRVYRLIAPLSAALFFAVTALPPVPTAVAVAVFGALMVSNVGRMIAAMAMITGSVEPRRRGGFMSANSSIQHIAGGLGASIGGLIITQTADGRIEHFTTVGTLAALTTLSTLWLAGRVRQADAAPITAEQISLAAAAEATADSGETMIGVVQDDRR